MKLFEFTKFFNDHNLDDCEIDLPYTDLDMVIIAYKDDDVTVNLEVSKIDNEMRYIFNLECGGKLWNLTPDMADEILRTHKYPEHITHAIELCHLHDANVLSHREWIETLDRVYSDYYDMMKGAGTCYCLESINS